ncbi:MAG: SRPBCC family protein, partial [Chloroflexota bacterium]
MVTQYESRIVRGFDVDRITPAPLQLIQFAQLKAQHTAVFDVVSDHGALHKFTGTITHIDVDHTNTATGKECGVGTLRYCHTPLRMTIQESIVCWEPSMMYGYRIRNFQSLLPDHLGIVTTEPATNDTTLLTWRTYFHSKRVGGHFARVSLGVILPDM